MLSGIFSDHYANRDNFLTNIDPRIKMIFIFGAIVTVLSSRTPYLAVTVAALSALFLCRIGIPLKVLLSRLAAPLTVTIIIVFIQTFSGGNIVLLKLDLFGLHLAAYADGLSRGLMIMGKALGCVSLIIFLGMTTPVNALLQAAAWFKMPGTWIEVAAITYRYIFVLIEDALTIRDAQRVRLGYSNLSRSLRSSAELAGSVLIRAYDQSLSSFEAMRSRGYSGSGSITFEKKFKCKDGLHLIIFALILVLLSALNLYWR